jgi:hypothetical protein
MVEEFSDRFQLFILRDHITDWVWHLHREGKLLDAIDPVVTREQFDSSDARRLLLLGLACSGPNPSERPSMMEALHTMPKNLISDASRQSSVTRKKRVTILASVIRANQ